MKNKNNKEKLIEEFLSLEKQLSRRPIKSDSASLNYRARRMFGSWNNFVASMGYPVYNYQKVVYKGLDEKFAYFLGLVITDGTIYRNLKISNYKVAIYTSYPEEKQLILKLIKDLFGYTSGTSSRMYGFNKRPNFEIRIASKPLAELLINEFDIPSGAKSRIVRIPKKILNGTQKIKKAFLRGVIDGDGSISHGSIKIASGSTGFLEDMKILLSRINLSAGSVIDESSVYPAFSIRINKKKDTEKIKAIYDSKYSYPRKKKSINNI